MKEVERSVDSGLWHACAGGMTQMCLPNSKVFYFPQGHAEHTLTNVDFAGMPRVPPFFLCRVVDVKFMADLETDEVYAKIMLSPLGNDVSYDNFDDERSMIETHNVFEASDKPSSFAKTLTQSDANNGGGFSVPRYCAETIFPKLDYSADPPVQTVVAKDVHGEIWKFRHIYRGTPRRHLLTTGWSTFVNLKKLVAGDSIVFMRADNGELYVGIRRAKRAGIGGPNSTSGWSSSFFRETGNKLVNSGRNVNGTGRGKVRPEDVIEATSLAANGQTFEITYYPRASTPEFVVKASLLNAALRVQWCVGMRFKMAFETEDSSRISWFMGTVSSVQVVDPFFWPNSPWRLLQVDWDEPELLQNVKRVSPWLVELVSSMPLINLSPFSPHRKKLRLPRSPDIPKDGFALPPSFSVNPHTPSSCFPAGGIQGARHARFQIPFSDLNLTQLQLNLFPKHFDSPKGGSDDVINGNNDDMSCLLTIGNPSYRLDKNEDKVKVKSPIFLLFGQPIHIDQQSSQVMHSSDENAVEKELVSSHCCEVFLESENVGRTLDLSVIGSYEELDKILASWFGIEQFNDLSCVIYNDSEGVVKQIGDEPFSEFVLNAKRLTILLDVCGRDDGRNMIAVVGDISKETGHASIFV
ncbi:putative transcription factor ARF family [Helianthus annuus]|nr:putative transcription factor ARF family [Helianthus annuus]